MQAMDLLNLSSNWKKLQATLQKSQPAKSSAKPVSQNGLKRKRHQSQTSTKITKGSLSTKRVRTDKGMSQNGTVSAKSRSIRDLENSDGGVRPRPVDRAASDQVNAGLSTSSVSVPSAICCRLTVFQSRGGQICRGRL